jgi:anti-sigma factor RsiW
MANSKPLNAEAISEHILEWNDRLQDWLDGDFSQSDRAEFEKHLATCEICQEQVAQFQSLETSLTGGVARPQLDASFDARLMAQIDSMDEARRTVARQRAEEERQRSLDALARSWRRTLAFVLPGILGGIALAFALAGYLDASGITDKLAVQGASELGGSVNVMQFVLTAILGAAFGGIMARWLSRAGE